MQMRPTSSSTHSALIYYLKKNFYKTASLMGHSCLAAAILGSYFKALRCMLVYIWDVKIELLMV